MAFENVFDSLPGNLGARAKALVEKREAEGLNVHFINQDGKQDRYSFNTADDAAKFRANLKRNGMTIF